MTTDPYQEVALITGATGALGSALSRHLARQGITVILCAKNARKLDVLYDEIETAGGQAVLYPVNFEGASFDDYTALAEAVGEQFGHLDWLFHAAARFDTLQPVRQIKPEVWLRTMQVNVNAAYLLSHSLLPQLEAARQGRLVLVLENESRMARPYWGAYGVSKSALAALANLLEAETDAAKVKVLRWQPEPFASGMRSKAYPAEDAQTLDAAEDRVHQFLRHFT